MESWVLHGIVHILCSILGVVSNKTLANYHIKFLRKINVKEHPYDEIVVAQVMYVFVGCCAIALGLSNLSS